MKAGRSRDTLQGVDQLNQKVTIEPAPHQQATLAAQPDLNRLNRRLFRGLHLHERWRGRSIRLCR